MSVKNNNFGGTDFVDDEVPSAADLNDTFDASKNYMGGIQITTEAENLLYTSSGTEKVIIFKDDENITAHTSIIVYKDYGEVGEEEIVFDSKKRIVEINNNITVLATGVPNSTVLSSFSQTNQGPIAFDIDNNNLVMLYSSGLTRYIWIFDGISTTVTDSFELITTKVIRDITIANGNLIAANSTDDKIIIYSGISNTVSTSFSSPSTVIEGITFDGTNLISSDSNTNKIYIHSGLTSTITSSFTSPSSGDIGELAHNGITLISCSYDDSKIYVHSGTSSTILDSFASNLVNGITFNKTNLLSHEIASPRYIKTYAFNLIENTFVSIIREQK